MTCFLHTHMKSFVSSLQYMHVSITCTLCRGIYCITNGHCTKKQHSQLTSNGSAGIFSCILFISFRIPAIELREVGMNMGTGIGRGNGTGMGNGIENMCIGAGTKIGTGTGMKIGRPIESSAMQM